MKLYDYVLMDDTQRTGDYISGTVEYILEDEEGARTNGALSFDYNAKDGVELHSYSKPGYFTGASYEKELPEEIADLVPELCEKIEETIKEDYGYGLSYGEILTLQEKWISYKEENHLLKETDNEVPMEDFEDEINSIYHTENLRHDVFIEIGSHEARKVEYYENSEVQFNENEMIEIDEVDVVGTKIYIEATMHPFEEMFNGKVGTFELSYELDRNNYEEDIYAGDFDVYNENDVARRMFANETLLENIKTCISYDRKFEKAVEEARENLEQELEAEEDMGER